MVYLTVAVVALWWSTAWAFTGLVTFSSAYNFCHQLEFQNAIKRYSYDIRMMSQRCQKMIDLKQSVECIVGCAEVLLKSFRSKELCFNPMSKYQPPVSQQLIKFKWYLEQWFILHGVSFCSSTKLMDCKVEFVGEWTFRLKE